jgi:hypothetical protein
VVSCVDEIADAATCSKMTAQVFQDFLPVPSHPGQCAVATFATPNLELAEVFGNLFRAIMHSFEFLPPAEGVA